MISVACVELVKTAEEIDAEALEHWNKLNCNHKDPLNA